MEPKTYKENKRKVSQGNGNQRVDSRDIQDDTTRKDCEQDLDIENGAEEYSPAFSDNEAIWGDRPLLTCVLSQLTNQAQHKVGYFNNLSLEGRQKLKIKKMGSLTHL